MKMIKAALIAGGAIVALAVGGVAIASSNGGDGDERPITGSALDQASAAALDYAGSGTVHDTEVGDEESYYELEVVRDDGSELDVQLDRDFNVVGANEDDPDDKDHGPEDE